MKKDLTELVILLDKSGSMSNCVSDTIGGLNLFIDRQKQVKSELKVTLVQFDTYTRKNYEALDVNDVAKLSYQNYTVGGGTALLDAVGIVIEEVGARLAKTLEKDRPEKVLFLVMTDGEENSSKVFTKEKINEMVQHQKSVYSWDFIFLGADINKWDAEKAYGNVTSVGTQYVKENTRALYTILGDKVASYRNSSLDLKGACCNFTDQETENLCKK